MIDYTKVIEELNNLRRKDDGLKRYLEVKIPKKSLRRAMREASVNNYDDFMAKHGLKTVSKVNNGEYVTVLVDPERSDHAKGLKKLSSKFNIPITEFYGVVQLDGDEPDAQRNYDNPLPNGLTTMEIKRREREIEGTEPISSEKPPCEKDHHKKKTVKKSTDEATGIVSVPSKVGTIDIMTTPIQKNRKKVNVASN